MGRRCILIAQRTAGHGRQLHPLGIRRLTVDNVLCRVGRRLPCHRDAVGGALGAGQLHCAYCGLGIRRLDLIIRGGDLRCVTRPVRGGLRVDHVIRIERRRALQEVAVFGLSLVPCGIQAVVLAVVHPHDVPGVTAPAAAAIAQAGDDAAVDARVVGQAVEQIGVALTHRRLVDGRRVGGVLQIVAVIVQVLLVISDITCDPVVDSLHLLIGGLAIQRQLRQDGALDIAVQLRLLLGRGIPQAAAGGSALVGHRKSDILAVIRVGEIRAGKSAILPAQVVAGSAAAGHMPLCALPDALNGRTDVIAGGQLHRQCDIFIAGDHLLAQLLDSLRLCQVIDTIRRLCSHRRLRGRDSLYPDACPALQYVRVYRVDILRRIDGPCAAPRRDAALRRQHLGGQQRQGHDQRQQQRGQALRDILHSSPPRVSLPHGLVDLCKSYHNRLEKYTHFSTFPVIFAQKKADTGAPRPCVRPFTGVFPAPACLW